MRERPEFISIGIVKRAYGVRGEIIVIPITDNLQQFVKLKTISILDQQGERKFYPIEQAKIRANQIVLKLTGIDDRNTALALRGLYIDKWLNECDSLPADEFYIFDLIGLKVTTTDNRWLGKVEEVLTFPANDVYVVKNNNKEYLIPAIKDVVKKIDLEAELILIEPIDGLL